MSEIAQAERDVRVVRVEFGQEPGASGIGGEELDDRDEVGLGDAALFGQRRAQPLDRAGQQVQGTLRDAGDRRRAADRLEQVAPGVVEPVSRPGEPAGFCRPGALADTASVPRPSYPRRPLERAGGCRSRFQPASARTSPPPPTAASRRTAGAIRASYPWTKPAVPVAVADLACLALGDPNADQTAANIVPPGHTMKRLTGPEEPGPSPGPCPASRLARHGHGPHTQRLVREARLR